jgi:hypothetical protein
LSFGPSLNALKPAFASVTIFRASQSLLLSILIPVLQFLLLIELIVLLKQLGKCTSIL